MTNKLKETISLCNQIIDNCDRDFLELDHYNIDSKFFDNYTNIRIVNSFLFNFSKLQDKIGAKLFKQTLYELKEIDDFSITMIDTLNILEKLNILTKQEWEQLREIRNLLAHEYPFCIDERIENISLCLDSYTLLKVIFGKLEDATKSI